MQQNFSKTTKLEEDKNKDNEGYDDFQKGEPLFVTNLPNSP